MESSLSGIQILINTVGVGSWWNIKYLEPAKRPQADS